MPGFNPNEKITDRDYLFGRNKHFQELENVLNYVRRGSNCHIQGERRFGKTSILNCVYTSLKKSSDKIYIPVYLDLKQHSLIKGTANVYRHIVSCLVSELTANGFLNQSVFIKDVEIFPSNSIEKTYELLLKMQDFWIGGIFESLITEFAVKHYVNFVLLIDEYEYLLSKCFTEPEGFVTIRNASEEHIDYCKPLTYVISGNKEWSKLCTQMGSPELDNQASAIIYVGAISETEFAEMFDFYTSLDEPRYADINLTEIYSLSGGVPYYAKKIVETKITTNRMPSNLLNNELKSVFDNLEKDELYVLEKIVKGDKIIIGNLTENLRDRGILKEQDSFLCINGTFLEQYLKNQVVISKEPIDVVSKLRNQVDDIFSLIENINKNYKNTRKSGYVFEPVVSESSQRKSLTRRCSNESDFKDFINTAYVILFERSARDGINLKRIPPNLRTADTVKRIDSLRQEYIHLTDRDSYATRADQYSRESLFEYYLKSKAEPSDRDFITLQLVILSETYKFLQKVNAEIVRIQKQ